MSAAIASKTPRWSLDSPLAKFMAAAFKPYIDGDKYTIKWLADLTAISERPPVLGDLTDDTFDAALQTIEANAARFKRKFLDVWRCAAEHVAAMPKPKSNKSAIGVPFHGPCKWTKGQINRLLSAAERVGGSFKRRLLSGSEAKVSRAVWFAAYVRVARLTSLPWSQIENIRNGDITAGGMLVARPPKRGHQRGEPKAYPLGKATLAAIQPLRGDDDAKLFAVVTSPDTLRVYFRRLCKVARLASPVGYHLIFGNARGERRPGRSGSLADKVMPVGRFTLNSPLTDFVRNCYLPQKIGIKSNKTREHYQSAMKDFTVALDRAPKVRDLTDENLCRMLRYLESKELSPHTIQQRQNYMVALSNFCSKRRLINWWVELDRYPAPDVVPETWSIDEMKRLIAACGKMPGQYFDVEASTWWRAFHFALWDTGERTSAVLAIEPAWLNVEARVLAIPGPARKGGRKAATYELTPRTVAAMAPLSCACRQSGRKAVFAFPGCKATFYGHYTRLLKLAGLPDGRKHKPQKIRRTFATFVELAGGNATEALGHSTRRVTTEHYLDPTVIRKPPANRLLPNIEPKDDVA